MSKVIDRDSCQLEYNNCEAAISLIKALITEAESSTISLLSCNDKLNTINSDSKINAISKDVLSVINNVESNKEDYVSLVDKLEKRKNELQKLMNSYDKKHNKRSLFHRNEGEYYE